MSSWSNTSPELENKFLVKGLEEALRGIITDKINEMIKPEIRTIVDGAIGELELKAERFRSPYHFGEEIKIVIMDRRVK